MTAPVSEREERGAELLLLHCVALTGREETRPSALERLEAVLGDDLARLLVAGLALDGSRLAV